MTEAVGPLVGDFIDIGPGHPLAGYATHTPWRLVIEAAGAARMLIEACASPDYHIDGDIAVHRSARVEAGATLKGPIVVGRGCFIAANCLLRGGVWLGDECSVGPGVEIKSSFLFDRVRLAHFNFVGDSIIGAGCNFEAGSIVANHRNERGGGSVLARWNGALLDTGMSKFGALVGDGGRIGANAVLAPGTLLRPGAVVQRLALVDQEAE